MAFQATQADSPDNCVSEVTEILDVSYSVQSQAYHVLNKLILE